MRRLSTPMMGEINITPLCDVLLVLLIIFMIASPFLNVEEEEGEDLNVPASETAIPIGAGEHLLEIAADGELVLDDNPVNSEELKANLREWVDEMKAANEPIGLKLYIAAEETVTWKKLAEIITLAKLAGVEQIGMIEELLGGEVPIDVSHG